MPMMATNPIGCLVIRSVKIAPMRPNGPVTMAMMSLGIVPSSKMRTIRTKKIMIGTAWKMYFIDLSLHSADPSFSSVYPSGRLALKEAKSSL